MPRLTLQSFKVKGSIFEIHNSFRAPSARGATSTKPTAQSLTVRPPIWKILCVFAGHCLPHGGSHRLKHSEIRNLADTYCRLVHTYPHLVKKLTWSTNDDRHAWRNSRVSRNWTYQAMSFHGEFFTIISSRRYLWLPTLVTFLACNGDAQSWNSFYKAVWYQPDRASFAAEAGDPTVQQGNANPPQLVFIQNLYNNFQYIRNTLNANAVIVRLSDQDDWFGQYGGGWSYNPATVGGAYQSLVGPNYQSFMAGRAITQELILSMANAVGLKVIFGIEPSQHHGDATNDSCDSYSDDDSDEQPWCASGEEGAWDFIHQFFDPRIYYPGPICSTDLVAANIPGFTQEVCINGPYYSDPRVVGWMFDPDNMSLNSDGSIDGGWAHFINKYWPTFYNLVHWNGSQTAFAGIYNLVGAPESQYTSLQVAIDSAKGLFQSLAQPDVFGVGWYGCSTASGCPDTAGFMQDAVTYFSDSAYFSVPANHIIFTEGGDNMGGDANVGDFFSSTIGMASQLSTLGVGVWEADGYGNQYCSYSLGPSSSNPYPLVNANYDTSGSPNCFQYQNPGWHYNDVYQSQPTDPTLYGLITYTSLTSAGVAVQAQFGSH
jgi:hypothetical protein